MYSLSNEYTDKLFSKRSKLDINIIPIKPYYSELDLGIIYLQNYNPKFIESIFYKGIRPIHYIQSNYDQ